MTVAEDVARHYDDFDAVYRGVLGEHLHHGLWREGVTTASEAGRAMASLVGERLELARDERLLDVGCGYGSLARELAMSAGAVAQGITISERQWEQAVAGVEVCHGDWLEHPYAPDSFDAVIAIESLEHMEDPGEAFGEVSRVLRPRGRVVLGCWLQADELSLAEKMVLVRPIKQVAQLVGMSDERSLRAALAKAGLVVEQVEDLSRDVWRTWSHCLASALRGSLKSQDLRRVIWRHPLRSLRLVLAAIRIIVTYQTGALRYLLISGRHAD
ncbi:MAG: methyltransferase domain-containing protein [Verrucomicrobiota bacterium]